MKHQGKLATQNEQAYATLEKKVMKQEEKAIKQDHEIRKLKNQQAEREMQIKNYIIALKAPFSYVIRNAKQEFQSAKAHNTILYSETFFCLSGYKARMKIYLNGCPTPSGDYNSAKNKFISVFFQVMQGPFDDVLKWPMPFQTISLSLEMNGNLAKHRIIKSTESEEVKSHFVKPTKEAGRLRGYYRFLSLGAVTNDFKFDSIKFVVGAS